MRYEVSRPSPDQVTPPRQPAQNLNSSPRENPLEVVYYPPRSAKGHINPANNSVGFDWRGSYHGDFPIISARPISFKIGYNLLIEAFPEFISECVTDPADRPNASRASEDLLAGQGIFNPKLKETLGFSICLSPPGTRMFRKHPLSDKIREVLNKHRVTQTSEQILEKIIMDSGSLKLHKELSTRGSHTLRSKVQSFMTVTADEDADQVISFLNANTSVSAAYVSTVPMGDFYVAVPTRKTLSTQHNLKQELLFFLGLYNHYIASHATNSCSKQTIQQISEAQGIQLELSLRWTAYAYKSIEEIIFSVAEKLGAACLLLRIEAAVHQSAPQLRRELVYRGDIVGPSIINEEALKRVETAPPNTLKTIQKDKTSPKPFRAPFNNKKSGPSHGKNNFQSGRKYPYVPNKRKNYRPTVTQAPKKHFHSAGGTTKFDSHATNAGSRKKTKPSKPVAPEKSAK